MPLTLSTTASQVRALFARVDAELPPRLPEWDGGRRRLLVFLRKGEVAPVRYASVLNEAFREHLALPAWVAEQQGGEAADHAVEQASVGCHWMLTPDRPMTLVHATQKPICKPLFSLGFFRGYSRHFPLLHLRVKETNDRERYREIGRAHV